MNFQLIALFLEYSSASTDYRFLPSTSFFLKKIKKLAVPSPHFVSYFLDKILLPKPQNHAVMEATVRHIYNLNKLINKMAA